MTPGERRRRDRKWSREEHCIPCRREFKHISDEMLKELPHPKIKGFSGYHYVQWLIDNGHTRPLRTYLESL